MKEKSSNNTILIIIGVLILLVAIILAVLCIYGNSDKKSSNGNGGNNNSNNNGGKQTKTIDFDSITSLINNNKVFTTIVKCGCTNVTDETEAENAECETIEITADDALKIIEKLKSSKSSKEMPTSIVCSKYEFDINPMYEDGGSSLFGLLSQDSKSLLVGYNDKGYAFDYDEDLTSFFESLINK